MKIINFKGNIEGRDIPKGTVDVVVCDGFVGNVVLKFAEGLVIGLTQLVRIALWRAVFCQDWCYVSKASFEKKWQNA